MKNTTKLLELAYVTSKLAKQYTEFEEELYKIKQEAVEELIARGVLVLQGFHVVGEYTYSRTYGKDTYYNTKRFYANLYTTACGQWSFHLPRLNGRGKGYLGDARDLAENKEITKVDKKTAEKIERNITTKLKKERDRKNREIEKANLKTKKEGEKEAKKIEKEVKPLISYLQKHEIDYQFNVFWKEIVIEYGNTFVAPSQLEDAKKFAVELIKKKKDKEKEAKQIEKNWNKIVEKIKKEKKVSLFKQTIGPLGVGPQYGYWHNEERDRQIINLLLTLDNKEYLRRLKEAKKERYSYRASTLIKIR